MNPSATGWINKHFPKLLDYLVKNPMDERAFYDSLRAKGFIYGHSLDTLLDSESSQLKWTVQEKTKINLFDALAFTYYDTIANARQEDCLEAIVSFYRQLDKKEQYFIKIPLGNESASSKVEKIIHQRVQTNESALQKSFSHLITNALVFIDILSFDHYLITQGDPYEYAKNLEAVLTESIWLALQQKESKDEYNKLLIKLFESSVRYNELIKHTHTEVSEINLKIITEPLEQQYLLDLCSLSLWDDEKIDKHEREFIMQFCTIMGLDEKGYLDAVLAVKTFLTEHGTEISYLKYSNPIKHFYSQTTSSVGNLISRNSNRLVREIRESRDLVILLGQSTTRDLSKEERKVVKKQLLDICKSIPSLAVFLLPGGGLLLPILVRLIPTMLPSAFNENLED
ncbi:hypothetical protein DCS32_13015 [Dokdonia sp. Dokd-P16]|uniref:LETM1-related biofilm-associated protein n=1 Tax=Dokdonia sp. Dokd-P16 TaxID=2173169 RepID=UPI000D5441B7|nr:LETM1-related biofilm-associated protein [Dokdonia sp. Dokd-P16]AWH75047.1 hypothetical protein DCS32_13015 [Dokdonia sp. Dokd-P16]